MSAICHPMLPSKLIKCNNRWISGLCWLILILTYLALPAATAENKPSSSTEKHLLCLHSNTMQERSADRAAFDYAKYAKLYYNIDVAFLVPDYELLIVNSSHSSVNKVRDLFPTYFYATEHERAGGDDLAEQANKFCHILYVIKTGRIASDPGYPTSFRGQFKSAVHAMFTWEPHGDAYAAISSSFRGQPFPKVVPHIVDTPSPVPDASTTIPLRQQLNISSNTTVFCRHGGRESFDILSVHHAVVEVAHELGPKKVQFIFMNTDHFLHAHNISNIHFLPPTVHDKEFFFDACDIMIHGRMKGETFGLAVAEFSVRNKPVLTNFYGTDKSHIEILGEKGFVYRDKSQLKQYMHDFIERGIPQRDYNAYRSYEPQNVMPIFKEHFLDPLLPSHMTKEDIKPTEAFLQAKKKSAVAARRYLNRYRY